MFAEPCGLVVVETKAEEDERQGEKSETAPPEKGTCDQQRHAGSKGGSWRGCIMRFMQFILRGPCCRAALLLAAVGCSRRFIVSTPLLQESDHLPYGTHAHNRHALLLAEHTDADAHPGGQHSGPARLGRGGGGQEEDQGDKEEESCNGVSCWLAHALEGGCDYRLNFQRGR